MSEAPRRHDVGNGHDDASHGESEQPGDRALASLLTRAHEPPRIAPRARARILARLRAHARPERRGVVRRLAAAFRSRMGAAVALEAAAIAALVLSLLLHGVGGSGGSPLVHRNAGIGPRRVVLADGSSMVLDRGAEVRQLGPRRLELVRGQVLLDVVKGREALVVETRHGRALVLGTRLLVHDDGEQMLTAVARGSVQIESGERSLLLRAGEEGVLRANEPPLRRPARRLTYLASWAQTALGEQERSGDRPIRNGTLVASEPGRDQQWPLTMRDLTVDVHIEDGMARITIDQTFFNHVDRQLEGQYAFPLPADAAISRLAMYVDGTLVEGGIVERQRGRDVYETIAYRRRDPALLEWMAGNLFRVRIFPLPARSEKRIVLSYTQSLDRLYDTEQLVVPIPEIDVPVGHVSFRARVVGGARYEVASRSHPIAVGVAGDDRVVTFEAQDHVIGDDFRLTLRAERPAGAAVTRFERGSDQYLMARVQPRMTARPRPYAARRWVVLLDTSASRDRVDLKAQAYLLARLLREWDEDDQVAVVAFDTTTRVLPGGLQRVGDLDGQRLRSFLEAESRDGLGATDLGGALGAALGLLSGKAEGAPHVLYLGDGLASGRDNSLESLRRTIAGRAAFVGVAIGDRRDETLLRGLADATGGLFVGAERGDDLGWRAFDLVSALSTPRIVELEAKLADATGAPLAEAQLSASTEVSDGQDVVVVAKLPAGRSAAKLVLSGKLDGEPWSQTMVLGPGKPGARYLPRLWARRRVEWLLQSGPREHEHEITELGLEHFLLTPFTSLLVLENDAMYRQLRVNRGGDDDWARYPAPKTIAVKAEPSGTRSAARVPAGAVLLRTPLPLFEDARPAEPRWEQSPSWGDSRGWGLGFGSGHGRLGGSRRAGWVRMGGRSSDSAGSGLGSIGVLGGGGGGRGERAEPTRRDVVVTGALRETEPSWVGLPLGASGAGPAADPRLAPETPGTTAGRGGRAHATPWAAGPGVGLDARLPSAARSSFVAIDDSLDRLAQGVLRARAGLSLTRGDDFFLGRDLTPIALTSAHDVRLDDLTELVPALLTDGIDLDRERLLGEQADGGRGSIAPAARDLLERARRQGRSERYRSPRGDCVTFDADGRFEIEQHAPTGLGERVVYDGVDLHSFYAELGLATTRAVAPAELAVRAAHAPFALPSAARLEAGHEVTLSAARTLRIRPLGTPIEAATEIDLDESLRVSAWRGGGRVLRFAREGGRLSIDAADGERIVLEAEPVAAAPFDTTLPAGSIRLTLPARDPADWERRVETATAGSPEWIDAQHQRLAALAALGRGEALWPVLEAIHEQRGAVTRGELALASGGVRHATARSLDRIVRSWPKDDPVAMHVRAVGRLSRSDSLALFEQAAEALPGGLVGMLASYRVLLASIDGDDGKRALAQYRRFAARPGYPPLCYVAAWQLSNRLGWRDPEAALAAWEAVGRIAPLGILAGFHAAAVLRTAGRSDAAASRLEQLYEQADRKGHFPGMTRDVWLTIRWSGGGEARWRRFWMKRRARLLAAGEPLALVALVDAAEAVGANEEMSDVLGALGKVEVDEPTVAAALAQGLVAMGYSRQAWTLLEPHLAGPEASEVLQLASVIAEREGRVGDAAEYLARAMQHATEGMPLAALRGLYRRRFDLLRRAGNPPGGPAALGAALAVASEWRRDDPDNAEVDQLCAAALYQHGDDAQAWRHLSSIVERHPAEGAAYAAVAEVFEQRGRLAEAEALWRQASEVEPTNPTWLFRRAQDLLALDQAAAANRLLEQIDRGRWQDRFANTVWEARGLRERR